MGPTASGKTRAAVEIARRFPVDIVSVDSALVYREMDIGTAKPGPEVLVEAPHRLIDIVDPAEPYSAARFRNDARREMDEISGRDRVPLLVGGTGLYFRALERGLSHLPGADPEVRRRLTAEALRVGWTALHDRLARLDPAAARRIHPNDPQRIQRALEVIELTGKPLTVLWEETDQGTLPYRVMKISLEPSDREALHDRIARRLADMFRRGFIEEVASLRTRGDLGPELPSMRAVGYRQVWAFLEGSIDRDTMVERAAVATRQLAKRQLTWLRAEDGVHRFDSLDQMVDMKVLNYVGHALSSPMGRQSSRGPSDG
jgi:tRNA dimethylallyltransferase